MRDMGNKTTPSQFPDGLEIFQAGSRTATNGQIYVITESDVAATAAAYDPAVHEAPLVIGHPEDDHPAWGWVTKLSAEGGTLKSSHQQIDPSFAEYYGAGRVKKRSAAFYHPEDPANPKPGVYYLRHVGFLGAQPPAVKGLRDPKFAEGGNDTAFGLIFFSEQPTPNQEHPSMTEAERIEAERKAKEEAERKAAEEAQKTATAVAERDQARAQLAQFAEQQKRDRHTANVSFAETQVKAGRLMPKDKDMAVATLDRLAEVEPVEFSEGDTKRKVSPSAWLQELIAGSKPSVDFSEHGGGQVPEGEQGSAKGKSDAEIDKAAKAYANKHNVSYAEAVSKVVSFEG
ncbi:hypothetical protein EIC84_03435 [Comamonas sp. A23]|nr:hypothetical protein EIC84_03435 [Comamonas sp. A23]